MLAGLYVFQTTHVRKQADILKCSRYPDGCHLMYGQAMEVMVLVTHAARAGRKQTAQDIDKGCLACPIGADQTVDGPGLDDEGYILQGLHAAKPAGYVFDEQPVHPVPAFTAADRFLEKSEAKPLGRKRITRSRINPLIPMRIGPAVTPTPRKTSG